MAEKYDFNHLSREGLFYNYNYLFKIHSNSNKLYENSRTINET